MRGHRGLRGPGRALLALAACLMMAGALSQQARAQGKAGQRARAQAVPQAVIEPGPERGRIDWTRGLIIAVGAAAGDIRAPSPEMARVGAERRARAQARKRLRAQAEALRLGDRTVGRPIGQTIGQTVGQTVRDRAGADQTVAARLARALDQALDQTLDLDVDYGSDGSVMLTVGLPLEAVRLAVQGAPVLTVPPPAPAGASDGSRPGKPARAAPTAIIVDARRVMTTPMLGLALAAGDEVYTGPTVYYRGPARAAADPRAGRRPIRARALRLDDGRLVLASPAPRLLAAARAAGALIIVVIGKA